MFTLHGAYTYNLNVPVPSEIISMVKLSTLHFKRGEVLLMGIVEAVPMLASKHTILQMDMSLKA